MNRTFELVFERVATGCSSGVVRFAELKTLILTGENILGKTVTVECVVGERIRG
jgi:hypothetical protein